MSMLVSFESLANSKENIAVLLILTKLMEDKQLNANNAMELISHIITVIQTSKDHTKFDDTRTIDLTKRFIYQIAKGKDGILGTADDLIPASTLMEIDELLSTSMFTDILVIVNDLVKLRGFNVKRSMFCIGKMCLK